MFYRLRNDFRLSIITLLGASAVFGITPFALFRFIQSEVLAGVLDLGIVMGICAGVVYAWVTGRTRRAGLFLALVSSLGDVMIGRVVGEPGLFWLFPVLITNFFLASPRIAFGLNLGAIAAFMLNQSIFSSSVQMWSFFASSVVVSSCAFVFSRRTENQRVRLEHLATIDPLTGIKNRRSMDEAIVVALDVAARSDITYALVIFDIDHFKRVNDLHGHAVGDEVLIALVELVKQHARKTDQLFRFGGEEFVLLLPGVSSDGLAIAMNKLQQALHASLRRPDGQVTVSFGAAMLQASDTRDSWLERADAALYEAKKTGRDKIVYADVLSRAFRSTDA